MLISNTIDHRTRNINRDKGILQETFQNDRRVNSSRRLKVFHVYVLNERLSIFIKQNLTGLKRELDTPTNVVGDFNSPHSVTDCRQNTLIIK